jgi:DNA polymerase IV
MQDKGKEEYFRQLYALNESSDDEQDTNDAREVIKQSAQPPSSPFPVPSPPASARRSQLSGKSKKVPAIQRTTSVPVTSSSIIRETPLPAKKPLKSKPRYDISSPLEPNQTFSNLAPPTTTSISTPALERSSSTPNLGFQPILAMPNSTGVESMLKRKSTRVDSILNRSTTGKRKRKEKPLKMVPESKQVFAGKTFFFIPNDDVADLRRVRITNARSHGAAWVKEVSKVFAACCLVFALHFSQTMAQYYDHIELL